MKGLLIMILLLLVVAATASAKCRWVASLKETSPYLWPDPKNGWECKVQPHVSQDEYAQLQEGKVLHSGLRKDGHYFHFGEPAPPLCAFLLDLLVRFMTFVHLLFTISNDPIFLFALLAAMLSAFWICTYTSNVACPSCKAWPITPPDHKHGSRLLKPGKGCFGRTHVKMICPRCRHKWTSLHPTWFIKPEAAVVVENNADVVEKKKNEKTIIEKKDKNSKKTSTVPLETTTTTTSVLPLEVTSKKLKEKKLKKNKNKVH